MDPTEEEMMDPTAARSSPSDQGPLWHGMALNLDHCLSELRKTGKPVFPSAEDIPGVWCNATWDTVLCWPAIPANTSTAQKCPPMKGVDPDNVVRKVCDITGEWARKDDEVFDNSSSAGYTDYYPCFLLDPEAVENSNCDEVAAEHSTDAWMKCCTILLQAQVIAQKARIMEFVGLSLSFLSLLTALVIFWRFRRLRVFRNQIHQQLMIAIWICVVIRLVLYIDHEFTQRLGNLQASDIGHTINTSRYVCEAFYALLEYAKTVAFAWMFIEGFYLHNILVVTVFQEEPKLWKYMCVGWGVPIFHVSVWLSVIVCRQGFNTMERCLGSYYLHPEFWILDGVRMSELLLNFFFLLNIVRVLWLKVMETHTATESEQAKKSVKAALMLLPLLGIPNILQTIPFKPTKENITWFAIYTYVASFSYMYQGFFIAVLYCFTNREVIETLKQQWQRYRIQHRSAEFFRRGSRAPSVMYTSGGSGGAGHQSALSNGCRDSAGSARYLLTATNNSEWNGRSSRKRSDQSAKEYSPTSNEQQQHKLPPAVPSPRTLANNNTENACCYQNAPQPPLQGKVAKTPEGGGVQPPSEDQSLIPAPSESLDDPSANSSARKAGNDRSSLRAKCLHGSNRTKRLLKQNDSANSNVKL